MGSLGSSDVEKRLAVESVDTEAACALLASEQYGYVDVRMWEDFDKGHVAGARNVPYYLSVNPHGKERNLDFVDQVAALHSKQDRLLVGCRSGVRSRLATADLVAAGFTKVKNLEGGYLSLLKSMGSLRSSMSTAVESVDAEVACGLLALEQYGYLDVRMWEDFEKGHVAGARNVPYYLSVTPHGKERNPDFVDQVAALHSKEDRFLVGCRSGVRSRLATADLVAAGFANVKNLEGGYLSLLKSTSYPQPEAASNQ